MNTRFWSLRFSNWSLTCGFSIQDWGELKAVDFSKFRKNFQFESSGLIVWRDVSSCYITLVPVRVAERSKAELSSFARTLWSWVRIPLTAWMFGVYMRLFCICAVLCLCSGLATSWSVVQGVLPIVNRSGNWKGAGVHKGCRAIKKIYSSPIRHKTKMIYESFNVSFNALL
jgi:hypothetical protein